MNNPSFFNTILVWPIVNVLVAIYHGLSFLHIPFALGFAIILLTILIRFILYPLTASQLKASKKMQTVAPHISKLKEKHKGDVKRIQQETMRLYKEHGVNPAAGCLPVLLQLPLIWALYSVLQQIVGLDAKTVVSTINKIVYIDALKLTAAWDPTFFGFPLGQNPSQLLSSVGPVVLLVPLLTGFFQFIQSKMMAASKPPETPLRQSSVGQAKALAVKEEKKQDDFASAFQTQSLYIFPVMIGFFSYSFPIGLSLYWNTFTIFGILQQYKISGLGALEEFKNIVWKKNQ